MLSFRKETKYTNIFISPMPVTQIILNLLSLINLKLPEELLNASRQFIHYSVHLASSSSIMSKIYCLSFTDDVHFS
jgi:hypothetical protein